MFDIKICSASHLSVLSVSKKFFHSLSQFRSSSGGRLFLGKPSHHMFSWFNSNHLHTALSVQADSPHCHLCKSYRCGGVVSGPQQRWASVCVNGKASSADNKGDGGHSLTTTNKLLQIFVTHHIKENVALSAPQTNVTGLDNSNVVTVSVFVFFYEKKILHP